MNKDRVEGSAKQVQGSLKEAVGKALGNSKLLREGRADRLEGKIQNAIGGVKATLTETEEKSN